jgi:hypothetical protein
MSQPDRCSDLSLRDSGLDQPTLENLVAVAREAASAGAVPRVGPAPQSRFPGTYRRRSPSRSIQPKHC